MKVLFCFAHPDDESFSSGGTIALLAKKHTVHLITATRGEAGEVGSPPLTTKLQLPKVREQELADAAKILGIARIHFLGFIDGTLNTLSYRKLSKEILKILKKEKPSVMVTFNQEGGSKHPDHRQISKATTYAFFTYVKDVKKHVRLYYTLTPRSFLRKLLQEGIQYTGFGIPKGTPKSHITTVIHIASTLEKKLAALRCHKSQHKDVERFMKRKQFEEFNYEFFRLIYENSIE